MSTLHLAWSQAVTRLGSTRVHGYEHSLQPACSAQPHPGVFDRDERRESQPLTPPSSPASPEGSPLGSRPTTKTAATQSPVKDSGISRPETPAIGKETSSAPLLISCGIPRTIQRSMPLRSRWAEALRSLGPATPLSRNRGSCPNRTPLTDFCFQTPSAGTTTNNCSPRETALSRFPLAHQDRSPASCGRRGTRVTPGWPPKGRPHRPEKAETACVQRRRGQLVPSPNTSVSPKFCCTEPEDWMPSSQISSQGPRSCRPRERGDSDESRGV